jgi:opacity protein-like surface antigen
MLAKYKFLLLILLASFGSQSAFSNNTQDLNTPDTFTTFLTSSFVGTLSVGPAWENAGKNQTLNLAPDIEKSYVARSSTSTAVNTSLFIGIQKPFIKKIQGQIGLSFAQANNAPLSGQIWDDANATFNNYTYKYELRHTHIAAQGKLLGDWAWPVLPWISAAIGVGFNQAHNFTNTPTISQAIEMPNFSSNTTTAFTYVLGIGVQRVLSQHWQIGAGYEFSDWGNSQLGPISGTDAKGLELSHFYTNSLMLNLTYLA